MSISANSLSNSSPALPSLTPHLSENPGNLVVRKTNENNFSERRETGSADGKSERRQFGSSYSELSPDARELALTIDRYKVDNRRRYITCEEMLSIVKQLGYRR